MTFGFYLPAYSNEEQMRVENILKQIQIKYISSFYKSIYRLTLIGHFSSFMYGQVGDWLPNFDEKNDQFVEMSRSKERIIKELYKHMKNLVEKMDEDTNKLLAEINAVYDNIDAKFDQIKKQNNQNKDDILAQDNANAEKILAKLASLELKLESKTCEQTPEEFFRFCLDSC